MIIGIALMDPLHDFVSLGLNFLKRTTLEATDLIQTDLDYFTLRRPRRDSWLAAIILVRLGVSAWLPCKIQFLTRIIV